MSLSFFIYPSAYSKELSPWKDQQWLKLLRYKKSFSGFISEVDNQEYFYSKDGKTDPKKEYFATIKAFNLSFSDFKNPNKHPVCQSPGKYIFLRNQGASIPLVDLKKCDDYWTYKNKLNLKSISVIFSSFYIDKPASAFGHTLLKLNSNSKDGNVDLNSYGVDFSAQVTTKNPILYGIYGIIGGFYGRFSLLPYFLKLREYNDYESRDLWEFELNFTEAEKELFIAHLWDMNLALFDYYYFTENCSYHVLRIIDAVSPKHKLIDKLNKVIIPIDTITPLLDKKSKLISDIYFRPSSQKRMKAIFSSLDGKENKYVHSSIKNFKLDERIKLGDDQLARALDAIIEFTDYKYAKEMFLEKNNSIQDFKQEVLIKRSEVHSDHIITKKRFKKNNFNIPHGTRASSLGLEAGDRNGYHLSHRSALHNILEPSGDTYDNFTLEMNKINLFYNQTTKKIRLGDYQFARVFTLRPLSLLEKKISWDFNFGFKQNTYNNDFVNPYLNVGVGGSLQASCVLLYSLVYNRFENGFAQDKYKNNQIGLKNGVVFPGESLRFDISYLHLFDYAYLKDRTRKLESEFQYTFNPHYSLGFRSSHEYFNNTASIHWFIKY